MITRLYSILLYLPLVLIGSHAGQPSAQGLTPFKGNTYPSPVSANSVLNTFSGVTCGGVSTVTDKGTHDPMSLIQNGESEESCSLIRQTASSLKQGGEWIKAHDTLIYYVEHCTGIVRTFNAFSSLTTTNFNRSSNPDRYREHREWLKNVLYYDPDSLYYCEDVNAIIHTFAYFDSIRGSSDALGQMAVLRFLLEENKCVYLHDFFRETLTDDSIYIRNVWSDTVTDPTATPLDTTVPSLEDLDLGILRGPLEVASEHLVHIGNIIAERNPFTDALDLKYKLEHSGMVRIDIHDVLGRSVYAEGQGYKQPGDYRVSLQTHDWASGTYYVRLSTPSGEVKTVKVIKE
jgi:hypothetical protein